MTLYLLIKYIKSVLWRVSKCLSYIEEARCLKVKTGLNGLLGTVPLLREAVVNGSIPNIKSGYHEHICMVYLQC